MVIDAQVVVIILILFVILFFLFGLDNNIINARIYSDKGTLIKKSFSVYNNPIPSNFFIDFTVSATNDGAIPLSCYPKTLSPYELEVSLNKDPKNLFPNKKVEWSSGVIPLSAFSGKVQRFYVSIECSYSDAGGKHYLNEQTDFIDLTIKSICGDGICNNDEDKITCPQDCFIGPRIIFRTNNFDYKLASIAFALNGKCGNPLIKYSYTSQIRTGCSRLCDCDNEYSIIGNALGNKLLTNLPDKYQWELYEFLRSPGWIALCKNTNSGPFAGKEYTIYYYQPNSTVDVSDSIIPLNTSMEVNC